jgi:iron complex outermembrane receptor protein
MLNKVFCLIVCFLICFALQQLPAQNDTLKVARLQTFYVTEKKPSFATTSRNITALTNSEMKESGAQTLSDALASLPGVSQLTTGAISKPVIRGLSGNRIQINVAGLRLEDQQWEDEHGLGLSDVGVERVELIKGPAALLFGSDAIGGVINIIEEDLREPNVLQQNLNLKLFSNTYGSGLDYGLKKSGLKNTLILRAGHESHADYSDGNGKRVPDTRFSLSNFKAAYIIRHKNWVSDNRFLSSYNRFGFIADTSELHKKQESPRLSREFTGANHSVLFGVFSSKNTLTLNEKTTLTATLGIQTNHRQEQERSNRIDLDLWLHTFNLNVAVQRELGNNWTWTNGMAGMLQYNINFGSRIIVPDANILEGSLFSYLKKRQNWGKNIGNFEIGMRVNERNIATLQTRKFNLPTSEIPPFNHNYGSFNGAIGQSLSLKNLTLKANIETGFRAGNLAELAANGLHEGTPNWYVGNPNMKVEQSLNSELSATWQHKKWSIRGSAFYNHFYNYIYLTPTNQEYFGFRVFRFIQNDATLKGFELGTSLEKEGVYSISADYSYLSERLDNGGRLPFTPANRLLFNSKLYLPFGNPEQHTSFLSLGAQIVSAQNHPAENETATPAYFLLQAGAGMTLRKVRILLTGRNLLNEVYNDHLSRLRLYGVRDMGRNIVLNFGWQF